MLVNEGQLLLRPAARTLFWLGVAYIALGAVALALPLVSTLAIAVYLGCTLLVSGAFLLVGSFALRGTGPFFGALLLSLVSLAMGSFLVANPLSGAVALTLVVGVIFAIQAAFELFLAFEMRPGGGSGVMAMSAITSALIALLIISGWPGGVSQVALGVLLGVNFMTSGFGYIALSRALKREAYRSELRHRSHS